VTNTLGVHVLNTLENLVDNPGDFNLSDILFRSDHIQKLATSGQLSDKGHLVLVVIDLDQTDEARVVEDIHHFKLIQHPRLVGVAIHHLGSKVAPSESIWDHSVILSWSLRLLDISVQPPVLGLCLLDGMVTRLLSLDRYNLLDEVGDTLGASAYLLAGVVELVKALGSWNYLLGAPVGHPFKLLFILENADHHGEGNGAADIVSRHGVEALVLGDVVLEEQSVGLRRIVVSLDTGGLLQRLEVLVPDHIGLGDTKNLTLDLATVDTNQIDVKRCLDKLGVLSHHNKDWLHHVSIVIDTAALIGTNIRGTESIDAELDNTVSGVVNSVLISINIKVLALKLEADLGHGESIKVPCNIRAGVFDRILSDLLLL